MTESAVPGQIFLVRDRLEFVTMISSLNPLFLNPKLIRHTPNGGWTHPWKYFDSLRTYLLLTCFDLLGQPHSFKDFQSWLAADSTKAERAAVLQKLEGEADPIELVKAVHRAYLISYGTKNSFYRFIQHVLPKPAQDELYYSVRIREIDPGKNLEIGAIESDESKIAFLYGIRNSFTHAGINTGSPAGGVWEGHGRWIEMDGKLKKGWEPIHWEERKGLCVEYSVRDWPDVLFRAVQTGLSQVAA
jgi:hypothetical protein